MIVRDKSITVETAKALRVFVSLFAVVLVMLLAMSTTASAFSITGKVVAINTEKETLTVAAYYGPDYPLSYSGNADRLNTFALKHNAAVMRGSERLSFKDIRVGDWVTVNYYETGSGLVVADGIAITAPPVAYMGRGAEMYSLPGKVVSIDRDARTFTLDPSYYYGPAYVGERHVRVFAAGPDIVVMKGSSPRDFRDLIVGDWVTVNYYEEGNGRIVAEGIAITAPPAPYVSETSQTFSIPGKVVAIDRETRTLTIDPSFCYGENYSGTRGLRVFTVDRGTVVMLGNEREDFRDIKVGDWVTVNFHERGNGLVITDGIAFTSPAVITCPEKQG